ncbi:hypothetical protein niasHT_004496 [Heterodera trifolii]|uniref:DUF7083 domain-containing protein n=1 Tax=Heterodera trifolii TaxID=157864 RepID=A0ABD2MDJ8_9BILA
MLGQFQRNKQMKGSGDKKGKKGAKWSEKPAATLNLRFSMCASNLRLKLALLNVRSKLALLKFAPLALFKFAPLALLKFAPLALLKFAPLALLKFHFSECACSIASLRVSIALLNVRFQFALLQCALLQFAAFALVEFAPFALLQLCEIGSLPGLWGTSLCPLTNTHLCYAFFQICTSSMCASPIGTSHVGRHMLRLTQKPQRDGSSSVGSGFGLGRHRGANSVPILPDISPFEPTDDKSRISEWIERFKFALDCTAPTANDEVKVKCLMNKLSESAFSEYSRSVLPSSVTDFDFKVTTEKLEKLFAKAQSIFIDRYECLKAVRGEGEQFRQFINRHRKLLTDFKFDELTKEQFNCLMLLMALKAPTEAALRQRILTKLAADSANISYDGVVEDLISFQSTISEAKAIEATSSSRPVNAIRHNQKPNNSPKKFCKESPKPNNSPNKFIKERTDTQATTTCWRCGFGVHRPDECRYQTSKCRKCQFVGHLDRQCERVQEWRKRQKAKKTGNDRVGHLRIGMTTHAVNSISLLKTAVLFNRKPVEFHLDTGSDIVVIDELTHEYVGRPPIEKCNDNGLIWAFRRIKAEDQQPERELS